MPEFQVCRSDELKEVFDAELDALKRRLGVPSDPDVPADEIKKLVQSFKDLVSDRTGTPFPQEPEEQLRLAISAVSPCAA